jgi:hypothetical protein
MQGGRRWVGERLRSLKDGLTVLRDCATIAKRERAIRLLINPPFPASPANQNPNVPCAKTAHD